MRIAITFLTCDRTEYTLRTLETLAAHNDLKQFELIHGDDASVDQAGPDVAHALGFHTRVRNYGKRRGVAAMTAALFACASELGADLVLNLQNDWECHRPIPLDDIEAIFTDPKVYCLRLYGAMKSTTGRCGLHHGGRQPRRIVEWQPHLLQGYEIGDIHWGHPPAVTRIDHAVKLTRGAPNERVSRERSGHITDLTARVIENVFWHIGRHRTPGFAA